jgi:O-succinylhomoserine sulfhydrylase
MASAGLASHPQHEPFTELLRSDLAVGAGAGYGGVFSFELSGGVAAAQRFMSGLQLALVAVSLGGTETLVTRPAATTHRKVGEAGRAAAGIGEGLVRVAVGVEDEVDLVADFAAALELA